MIKARQEADRQLGDHVVAIRRVYLAVGSQAEIVLTLPDGNRSVVPFFEINDVGVFIVLVDRKFRPRFDLSGVDQDPSIHRIRLPEDLSLHRDCRDQEKDQRGRLGDTP